MKHFEPGQPIICRNRDNALWNYSIYNRPSDTYTDTHITIDHVQISDKNILPFNDNTKHLLGTNNDYTEWEPEPSTVIAVRDDEEDDWVYRVFLYRNDINFYVCKVDGSTGEYAWQYATSIEESLKG